MSGLRSLMQKHTLSRDKFNDGIVIKITIYLASVDERYLLVVLHFLHPPLPHVDLGVSVKGGGEARAEVAVRALDVFDALVPVLVLQEGGSGSKGFA